MVACDMCAVGQHHTLDLPGPILLRRNRKIDDLALETIFAAELLDGRANSFHDGHQPEGADMRLGDVKYFRWRARLDEFAQHLAAVVMRVLDLAVELAIGKRA